MSNPTDITQATCFESTAVFCMARIYGNAGTAINQATISSITCNVFAGSSSTASATPTVTVASAVYDTLQTSDPRWTVDSTGYNWAFSVPASALSAGKTTYTVEFIFNPVSGDDFAVVFRIDTLNLRSS